MKVGWEGDMEETALDRLDGYEFETQEYLLNLGRFLKISHSFSGEFLNFPENFDKPDYFLGLYQVFLLNYNKVVPEDS